MLARSAIYPKPHSPKPHSASDLSSRPERRSRVVERPAVCPRAQTGTRRSAPILFLAAVAVFSLPAAHAQTAAAPANTAAPLPLAAPATQAAPDIPAKQLREADDAYLKGARALDRKDLSEAEVQFTRAAKLNPRNRDYAIALAVTREHRLTDLVQRAAKANQLGHTDEADKLLLQAREIDPQNAIVLQHFTPEGTLAPSPLLPIVDDDPLRTARTQDALSLAGPVQLTPSSGTHDFHLHAAAHDIIDRVCEAYGIRADVVNSINSGPQLRFDLDHADWEQALRALQTLTHTFSVPLQPTQLLFSRDTPENRTQYQPLVEETLFMPGTTQADLTEYANLARNVFNLRVVNAVNGAGSLVLRGDEDTLKKVNATFADLVDGGSDVLLDLTLYEVDKSHINNIGAALPSSIGIFPVAATAQNLINANQSIISQAVANNLITLTGNAYTDALTELEFLLASGTVSATQFSNLLGVFGHYGGLPLGGVFLGSTTTLNAALTSSDIRILDTVQLRVGDHQDGQFRSGTRYPIETGIYSSALPSSLANAAAGVSINGTPVSSLLNQYLGATSTAVPQVQYEDLGLTLKATPNVLRTGDVTLKLDLKIEALGSGTINTLPVLNSRQLTSTVTIPRGQTAMLASDLTTTELRALSGLPFLSEIPGFQSTNKSTEKDTTELMLTLTPHIVRNKNFHIASARLLLANGNAGPQQ
jgi:general secretion pathway protein D